MNHLIFFVCPGLDDRGHLSESGNDQIRGYKRHMENLIQVEYGGRQVSRLIVSMFPTLLPEAVVESVRKLHEENDEYVARTWPKSVETENKDARTIAREVADSIVALAHQQRTRVVIAIVPELWLSFLVQAMDKHLSDTEIDMLHVGPGCGFFINQRTQEIVSISRKEKKVIKPGIKDSLFVKTLEESFGPLEALLD